MNLIYFVSIKWFLRVLLIIGTLVVLAMFSTIGSTGSQQAGSTGGGNDPNDTSPKITLNSQVRYQTIDAWSVFAARYWQHDKKNNRYDKSYEQAVPAVTKFLVDDLGLNGVVIEFSSGFENPTDHWIRFYNGQDSYTKNKTFRYKKINDNNDPFNTNLNGFHFSRLDDRMEKAVLPFKREVEANGEKLYVRAQYVDFKFGSSQGTLSHAKNPDEFAEFVLVGFQYLKNKYGIVPDSFEVVLEPENTVEWRGEQIGKGLVAVKKRLNQNGFFPEIIAPSVANLGNAASYFDRMIKVPGVSSALTTVSYHRYGGESQANLKGVWDRARKHGMKTAMLENGGAGFNQLWDDLTIANVSEWMQWAAGINSGDGSAGWYYAVVNMSNPQNPQVSPGRGYANLSQIFRYVRGGAVRIDAKSDNGNYKAIAFMNKNGSYVTVIDAKSGGAVRVAGLPAGTYGVRFMDKSERAQQLSPVTVSQGQSLTINLPAAGVATAYKM